MRTFVALLLASTSGAADAAVHVGDFARLDVNADGRLSLEEFAADWFVDSSFALWSTADVDEDGAVSAAEFQRIAAAPAAAATPPPRSPYGAVKRTLAKQRRGGDLGQQQQQQGRAGGDRGIIPRAMPPPGTEKPTAEGPAAAAAAKNIFGLLDVNADGRISPREWSIDWHSLRDPQGLWKAEDKDGDGYVAWDEFGGPKGSSPEVGRQFPPATRAPPGETSTAAPASA